MTHSHTLNLTMLSAIDLKILPTEADFRLNDPSNPYSHGMRKWVPKMKNYLVHKRNSEDWKETSKQNLG